MPNPHPLHRILPNRSDKCNNDYEPDENGFMEMLIGDNVDWEYFLEGVKESLTWLLANNEGFKNWVGNRHVATGFDDGDLILLK